MPPKMGYVLMIVGAVMFLLSLSPLSDARAERSDLISVKPAVNRSGPLDGKSFGDAFERLRIDTQIEPLDRAIKRLTLINYSGIGILAIGGVVTLSSSRK